MYLPTGKGITFGTPPFSVVLILEIWGGPNPSAVNGGGGKAPSAIPDTAEQFRDDPQTPFSNCWSINALGATGSADINKSGDGGNDGSGDCVGGCELGFVGAEKPSPAPLERSPSKD